MLPQQETILLIDDSPDNLSIAVDHLRAYSYHILIARDGHTGIERAIKGQPHLILLDVQMPDIDGYETCRRLAANPSTRHIPVIFMTALDQIEDKIKAFDAGGIDFITKPFEKREMLARVRTHLKIRSLQDELEARTQRLEERIALESTIRASLQTQVDSLKEETAQEPPSSPPLSRDRLVLVQKRLNQARVLLDTDHPDPEALQLVRSHVSFAIQACTVADEDNLDLNENFGPFEILTRREREIARLFARGLYNKEVSDKLNLAKSTVSTHKKRIMDKMGVTEFSDVVQMAISWKLHL